MFNTDLLQSHQGTCIVLLLSIAITMLKPRYWHTCLISFLITAYIGGVLTVAAIISVGLLMTIGLSSQKARPSVQLLLQMLLIIGALSLALHLVPGFHNLLVIDSSEKSSISLPFSMYLNWDKALILFLFLSAWPTLIDEQPKVSVRMFTLPVLQFLLCTLLFISLFLACINMKLIAVDIAVPNWWWLFALNNLLITCVAEEVFFRGFILQKLQKVVAVIPALIISSLLFGLAHFSGGISYVIVASIAGVLYGLVYLWTGHIRYSIAVHFLVNLTHLIFFTYPMLK